MDIERLKYRIIIYFKGKTTNKAYLKICLLAPQFFNFPLKVITEFGNRLVITHNHEIDRLVPITKN